MSSMTQSKELANHQKQQLQNDTANPQIVDDLETNDHDEILDNEGSDNNITQQHSKLSEHGHESGINALHPIELTAHSVLNAPLDHLNEDFELLSQSQYILLTRLKLIEDRLKSFKKVVIDDGNMTTEKEISATFTKIRELKKRLGVTVKSLEKVEARVDRMDKKLNINGAE